MDNGYGQRCATCQATVSPADRSCGLCGAPLPAPPDAPSSLADAGAHRVGPNGLPTRVPGQTVGDSPWSAFARSWEEPRDQPPAQSAATPFAAPPPPPASAAGSSGAPAAVPFTATPRTAPPAIPPGRATASVRNATPVSAEDLAGAIVVDPSAARSRVYHLSPPPIDGAPSWRARQPHPAEPPPHPAEPPQPHEPPVPPEPPEPIQPPEPHEPPQPPVPAPEPPPVPQPPAPEPPFPPAPSPIPQPPGPGPDPGPPVPPSPPPTPFPTPPPPVPPPPVIGQAIPPGVYRGGAYERPDWRTTLAPDGGAAADVPSSRRGGNVYGGQTGLPTSANVDAPLELSGSLTGMILARGRPAQMQPEEQRSRTRRVVVILGTVLVIIIALGAMIAFFAGDIISALIEGAFKGG